MSNLNRTHLFLSYAIEDKYFTEWLARKLSAEGYAIWMEDQRRFRATSDDITSLCLHGQVLALAFGIGDPLCLLQTIRPHLENNLQNGLENGEQSGHLEMYFFTYLLPALARLEEFELAESLIEQHYGYLLELGSPTWNECFCYAADGKGSRCHSWSGAGAVYATSTILGLRQKEPGNPNHWLFNPKASKRFSEVSGILPHRRGNIQLAWKRFGSQMETTVHAPQGIIVETTKTLQHHPH